MPENRKLYRSAKNKIIFGVAGGLAHYFNIDPIIVRITFVMLALASGIGILGYLILWIMVPQEPGSDSMTGKDAEIKGDPPDQKK